MSFYQNIYGYANVPFQGPPGFVVDARDPGNFDTNFPIFTFWQNTTSQNLWYLAKKTSNLGYIQSDWVLLATQLGGVQSLTGNSGGAVFPDSGAGNTINVVGDGTTIDVTGNAGTHTLTISAMGFNTTTYVEDSGSATPAANTLNILGADGIQTSGSGSTVTIGTSGTIATTYNEDSGSATPSAGVLAIVGGTGVTTSGSGNTVTINAMASVPLTFTEDSGTATPSANNINILGGAGIATSGSGSSITITATAAGFSWVNVTGTSANMSKEHGYQANNAGLVTLTLPTTVSSTFGDAIAIQGFGAGGWKIEQNAGQQIIFGNHSTSVGAGGSLSSTNQYDGLELVCSSTTTTWLVRSSIGNITVV